MAVTSTLYTTPASRPLAVKVALMVLPVTATALDELTVTRYLLTSSGVHEKVIDSLVMLLARRPLACAGAAERHGNAN